MFFPETSIFMPLFSPVEVTILVQIFLSLSELFQVKLKRLALFRADEALDSKVICSKQKHDKFLEKSQAKNTRSNISTEISNQKKSKMLPAAGKWTFMSL